METRESSSVVSKIWKAVEAYSVPMLALTLLFVFVTDVLGLVRNFSPVPYWDMWDGYLSFYLKLAQGDWQVWLAQHNEHKIFLSRLLFWIDLNVFNGTEVFLILINLVLIIVCAVVMALAAHATLFDRLSRKHVFMIQLTSAILILSWTQHENLSWAFQSQFILAYLLPLTAFCALSMAHNSNRCEKTWFTASVLLGFLSSVSMANGVLALPLLLVMAICLGMSWWRLSGLIIATSAMLWSFFYNYIAPPGHGSLVDTLATDPIGVFLYSLAYVGSPLPRILPDGFGLPYARLFGGLMLIAFLIAAFRSITVYSKCSVRIALLIFVTYVVATAVVTAGGRLMFGPEQALSGRYVTPAILAWTALLILCGHDLARFLPKSFVCFLLVVVVSFIPPQLDALDWQSDRNTERLVSALSLELGVEDPTQVTSTIYPSYNRAADIGGRARELDISIFGNPLIRDAGSLLGRVMEVPAQSCIGSIDAVEVLASDASFVKIYGWFFYPDEKVVPKRVLLVNSASKIAGIAITGKERPDVAEIYGYTVIHSGFEGYVLSDARSDQLSMANEEYDCILSGSALDVGK